ncbi:hypothetical protein HMPREF1562_3308 [Providencia alcalifaciens F90-2004]|nr:hypothetical protein HMPREF1562_3308 [Providencia alcalifaciens F90-2004]
MAFFFRVVLRIMPLNTDMAAICGAACFMTGWALYVDSGVSVSK